MDPVELQRIRAISKSKKHQLLDNFFLYSMTVLTCSVFCSSPFWLPCLVSSVKLHLFTTLTTISSILLNSKFIFIVGNLIIILLIGESKFFTSTSSISSASDAYYSEYLNRKRSIQTSSTLEEKKVKENASRASQRVEKVLLEVGGGEKLLVAGKEGEDLEEEDEISLAAEELNKRAADFIARVNRQRMQEARLLLC